MKNKSHSSGLLSLGIFCSLLTLALPGTLHAQAKPAAPQVNHDAQIMQLFQNRVTEYIKLHKSIEGQLPPLTPTDSPEKILQHQQELARRIREARKQIAEGDIFIPECRVEFRRLIGIAMRGDAAARIQKSLANSEPVQFPLNVNASYPAGIALQTTPPTILQNLPKLPAELEYRIVDHQLILRDVNANLIIDFMAEAIP